MLVDAWLFLAGYIMYLLPIRSHDRSHGRGRFYLALGAVLCYNKMMQGGAFLRRLT